MSVTELQVIHKHVRKVSSSATGRRLLLPADRDQSDVGLVMKIDGKLSPSSTMMGQSTGSSPSSKSAVGMNNPSAVRPSAVSSQLCGQGHEVTGWVLRGVLFIQTTHIPLMKLTRKMSEMIQRVINLLMPIFFYMSLLVLIAQTAAVVMMFSKSLMPIGMWFLLSCIAVLAGLFCFTIVRGNPHNPTQTHSKFQIRSKQL